jgi:SAM-dependent methyltransferase
MSGTEGEAARGRPSAFFSAHLERVIEAAGRGPVLDLACGRGRHALVLAERGISVVALDRNRDHLDALARAARGLPGAIALVESDLESGAPPSLAQAPFPVVLVFRYLHRPLMRWIAGLLEPGGLLVYETFTRAQRRLGWGPARDTFLLESGELPTLFPTLEPLVYEEGPSDEPRPAETARLLARRPMED